MKKLISATILSVALSAQAFYVNLNCNVNQAHASCYLYNHWMRPITCQIQAQGTTYYGHWLNSYATVYVFPGQYSYIYVNAYNPMLDPLVYAQASANCF